MVLGVEFDGAGKLWGVENPTTDRSALKTRESRSGFLDPTYPSLQATKIRHLETRRACERERRTNARLLLNTDGCATIHCPVVVARGDMAYAESPGYRSDCKSELQPADGSPRDFDQALADVGLVDDGALRQVLHDYFAWATRKRCPATTSPPMMCVTASASHSGPGADSRCRTLRLTCTTPIVAPTSKLFARLEIGLVAKPPCQPKA
jgi:hypothetical protein